MNVPKALQRRRRFLQVLVNLWLAFPDETEEDRLFVEDILIILRAEIKWLNYMIRETTGRGRVR